MTAVESTDSETIVRAAAAAQVSSSAALKNIKGSKRYAVLSGDQLAEEKVRQYLQQRRTFANWTGAVAVVQILCADAVFIAYAWAGRHWDVPESAISAWLGATIIQVIAVVLGHH